VFDCLHLALLGEGMGSRTGNPAAAGEEDEDEQDKRDETDRHGHLLKEAMFSTLSDNGRNSVGKNHVSEKFRQWSAARAFTTLPLP
jgi:hypothetical protein